MTTKSYGCYASATKAEVELKFPPDVIAKHGVERKCQKCGVPLMCVKTSLENITRLSSAQGIELVIMCEECASKELDDETMVARVVNLELITEMDNRQGQPNMN